MSDSNDVQALRDEINELRAELNHMKDRQAILEVLHRYSKGLDRRDWELMKSAYHEDGIDRHGNFIGHPDTFVAWAADLFKDEWDYSLHFLDPNNIEIDGDVAHSECYVLFTQRRTDGSALEFGGGRYIDRLERRNGEWRIAAPVAWKSLISAYRLPATMNSDPNAVTSRNHWLGAMWAPRPPAMARSRNPDATTHSSSTGWCFRPKQ